MLSSCWICSFVFVSPKELECYNGRVCCFHCLNPIQSNIVFLALWYLNGSYILIADDMQRENYQIEHMHLELEHCCCKVCARILMAVAFYNYIYVCHFDLVSAAMTDWFLTVPRLPVRALVSLKNKFCTVWRLPSWTKTCRGSRLHGCRREMIKWCVVAHKLHF